MGKPTAKKELERVAELFFRTNRLNFNRRSLATIKQARVYLKRLEETGHAIRAVSIKDGGMSLGIQAAFAAVMQGKRALVTNGTISCSTMTFGDLETTIINELLKQLFKSANTVELVVKETPTNQRVRDVLKIFRFAVTQYQRDRYRFTLKKEHFRQHDIPWVKVERGKKVNYEYFGVPSVKNYFLKYEWKHVKPKSKVVVLGIGQGETLGTSLTKKFEAHLKKLKASYYPIDIEDYGNNIVADAEDLHRQLADASIDYVICTELLEHTEHYWNVINEMLRILRIGGRIFLSVPYNFPPHEYPIDKWRLSLPYLKRVFSKFCKIERIQLVGDRKNPRHIMMSLVKVQAFDTLIKPVKGKVDWKTGLVYI